MRTYIRAEDGQRFNGDFSLAQTVSICRWIQCEFSVVFYTENSDYPYYETPVIRFDEDGVDWLKVIYGRAMKVYKDPKKSLQKKLL